MNITEIKGRIASIEQTRKITKAMYLISSVKMRKALSKLEKNATYLDRLRMTIKDILLHSGDIDHPFIKDCTGNRTAFIVIAGDKGLAGPFNNNVLNMAIKHMEGCEERFLFTIGHMATSFFNRKNYMVDIEFLHTAQNPELYHARQISEVLIDLFTQGHVDRIEIIYTHLISTLSQEPRAITLLPMDLDFFVDVKEDSNFGGTFQYDPSPKSVFDTLVPQYLIGVIYSVLVQSYASEQCSRMAAMDSATQNADDIIKDLRLKFSRARQAAVTNEMLEVANATNAVLDL
ncbi:MAG: ATP synthase F1 subunit gamma [Clostridia bacterium]|nr:ATP synthase F1 subunit gamma [Clostridia bacterium]